MRTYPNLPILIYDGDCQFCRQNVLFLEKLLGEVFEKKSFRDADFIAADMGLTVEDCEREVILRMVDGKTHRGAEVFFKLLSLKPILAPLTIIYDVPGIHQLCDWLYRNIARYRFHFRYWE